MFGIVTTILKWLFSKAAMLIILWIVVLGAFALYLGSQKYLETLPAELAEKEAIVQRIKEEASQLDDKAKALQEELSERLASIEAKRKKWQNDLRQRQVQMREWKAQLDTLKGIKARALEIWNKLRGVDPQVEMNAIERQIASAKKQQAIIQKRVQEANAESKALQDVAKNHETGIVEEKNTKLEALAIAEEEYALVKSQSDRWESRVSKGQSLLRAAYVKLGQPLIILSLSIILVPVLVKIALFYFWAPLLSWGRPVMIKTNASEPVRVSKTAVSQEVVLDPGESATIQHRFYQASDEDLNKRTKFVFSWRYPFSCLACGLFLLTRVGNRDPEAKRRLTLSSQDEAEIEMATVEIPEGGSIICRPSFVAALIQRSDEDVRIRSHWRFFSLHAWITLQFRYFEFRGPVKLVLWAYRGVRAERLTPENIKQGNERRTNQLATIGFTPSLSYRSRRSETFISYLRDQNPLFDDLFSGQGVFLCQQISRAEHHRQAGNFWAKIWNGLTKIIGI